MSLIPIITDHVPTAATDKYGRVYINPCFFSSITLEQGAMVLVHEVWHILLDHAARAVAHGVAKEDHYTWNIAADMEINQHDNLANLLPTYDNGDIRAEPVLPKKFKLPSGLLAEQYFDLLKAKEIRVKVRVDAAPGAGQCGSCAHGEPTDYELPPPDATVPGLSEARVRIIAVETARQIATIAERGDTPAGWIRWANRLLKPQVDWRAHLRSSLQGVVISSSGRTYPDCRQPSRRQSFSDILKFRRRDIEQNLAFIIDTSGSMSENMLGQAIVEVDEALALLRNAFNVSVYFTDAAASAAQRVSCTDELVPIGGGGTDMREGFKAINDDVVNNNKIRPSIIVVVTDGETPWPDEPPSGSKVIVVLVGSGSFPVWCVPPDHDVVRVLVGD